MYKNLNGATHPPSSTQTSIEGPDYSLRWVMAALKLMVSSVQKHDSGFEGGLTLWRPVSWGHLQLSRPWGHARYVHGLRHHARGGHAQAWGGHSTGGTHAGGSHHHPRGHAGGTLQ